MKASDTVMSKEVIAKIVTAYEDGFLYGEEQGRKEVVDWMGQYYSGLLVGGINKYHIPRKDRDAKLKDWGIK